MPCRWLQGIPGSRPGRSTAGNVPHQAFQEKEIDQKWWEISECPHSLSPINLDHYFHIKERFLVKIVLTILDIYFLLIESTITVGFKAVELHFHFTFSA